MVLPDIVGMNVISENWGNELDDFWIVVQVDIGPQNGKGSETFTFNVTSPKRLKLVLEGSHIEIGRGLLIMDDYNKKTVQETVRRLVEKCKGETWDEVVLALCRYAYWEYEN
ncbi:Imm8 family immunity protein [Herbivorax sp. ANBcel31]|uniref:Imm8 family immunity protein n=1 Tax=Herbivorax sp. ANBcel31 TaxID=3069754 RepID=UPI0027B64AE4|nr:Imm8 family immunity protein [Herbivorax sp. ANBcel31]MDQ2087664.1 Imm8 family immunity protein [Herbivorax sp. ANBcel31]